MEDSLPPTEGVRTGAQRTKKCLHFSGQEWKCERTTHDARTRESGRAESRVIVRHGLTDWK